MCLQIPYQGLPGLQAAMAVVGKGSRPQIPADTPAPLAELIQACWAPTPEQRPPFSEIVPRLNRLHEEMLQREQLERKESLALSMV